MYNFERKYFDHKNKRSSDIDLKSFWNRINQKYYQPINAGNLSFLEYAQNYHKACSQPCQRSSVIPNSEHTILERLICTLDSASYKDAINKYLQDPNSKHNVNA
jgi:hypothetical protein